MGFWGWVAKKITPAIKQRLTPIKTGKRLYAGAQVSRLTSDWNPINTSGDSELVISQRILRARSRQLIRDNEYAKNIQRIVGSNVIGTGIGIQATVKSARGKLIDKINTSIEEVWDAWSLADSCHVSGKLNSYDIC